MGRMKLISPFIWGSVLSSVSWMAVVVYLWKTHIFNPLKIQEYKWKSAFPVIVAGPTNFTQILDDEIGLINSEADRKYREEGFKKYAFNTLISKRIGDFRPIPDTRHKLCKKKKFPNVLDEASIIVCFHNEDLSTLRRTVTTILRRTPDRLLKEVIIVDDNSDDRETYENIRNFVAHNYPKKFKVYRTPQHEGLIRARLYGAKIASAKVILFLDSHVEVNEGWIEPLLSRISENRSTVVTPVIDMISPDTFVYTASPLVRGGFNWGLHFKWDSLRKKLKAEEDFVKPIESPTMAGGLFAMDKKYFEDLGAYDPGMDVWGGENLEISFRIWMCGGRLEIVPCSRVGHIFRKRRPYGSNRGEDTITKNSLRMANVWMDEYIEQFFEIKPEARNISYGDISDRLRLRRELKCKDFKWYLENIYPELGLPGVSSEPKGLLNNLKPKLLRGNLDVYHIALSGTNLCLESKHEVTRRGSSLIVARCNKSKKQRWTESSKNELLLAGFYCLTAGDRYKAPKIDKCHLMGGDQSWSTKEKVGGIPLYSSAAGLCLGIEEPRDGADVVMTLCNSKAKVSWDLIRL
ncbi:polypeptide N-acetylgalactosaminyltransferase 11-like [Artemia franciscana]|uniref:Polypeptide N-acetylgalactosaminyltransferase n=1 Tax=Artemia franciscana TaxID=6661 RepID=A0AA88IK73_ARTSF|nr:hypothetical protein QYM36_001790 [Artemia franciscana]KAK2723232.1 hypothetical protein QYM36_001790 [Artemia franciscana]